MENENKKTVKAAVFMMIITLIGKILGLVREMFLAGKYSVGKEASAFVAASQIPRIFFDVIFASAISASFIPIFNEYIKKQGKEKAFRLSNNFVTIMTLLSTAITVFGIIFAPFLTNIFASGFDIETAQLCTKLLRMLFPTTIFTAAAFSFVGILQSMDEFNIPAAMSIASNIIIIIYFVFFNDKFGVYGLTVAFLIGWAMQAIIQIPSLLKKGYKYRFLIDINDDGIKRIFVLMVPVMVSTWIQPINLAINTNFASTLFEGSGVSALNYANSVYSIIIGVFVLSIANVIFPKLSRMSVENDSNSFGKTISDTLEVMAFFIIPMAIGLMVLSREIISLVFERGNFDYFAVDITSKALFYFSVGMPGFGIQNILSRAFYAKQKGRMPLISGIISILINVIICTLLIDKMDVGGLALASALSQTVAAIILLVPMNREYGIISNNLVKEIIKIIISAMVMMVSTVTAKQILNSVLSSNLMVIALVISVGVIVYVIMSLILRTKTIGFAIKMIKRGEKA